jgi:2'-5' RNA ligase
LKYGFPVEDMEMIERITEQFVLSKPKMKWFLHDFGYFHNLDKYVMFIDATPAENTRNVHEGLFIDLRKISWVSWSQFDTTDLHYHITLASNGITSKNFSEIWSYLDQVEKPDFEVQLDCLSLIRTDIDPPSEQRLFCFQE